MAVRSAREATQLSQEDLAHKIGMSRRYLSGIERGEANPSFDQLVRLAGGLGVTLPELLVSIPNQTTA
ncbi:MAG: helix-turn-helix domain-containing protein [Jatrophihabitans sp.]|uniref:helix-turn-helix domain-containing protein n=1 Tax=Jatrophihabitans sp. TaxID=1932789 RepID=UPI003F81B90C